MMPLPLFLATRSHVTHVLLLRARSNVVRVYVLLRAHMARHGTLVRACVDGHYVFDRDMRRSHNIAINLYYRLTNTFATPVATC